MYVKEIILTDQEAISPDLIEKVAYWIRRERLLI